LFIKKKKKDEKGVDPVLPRVHSTESHVRRPTNWEENTAEEKLLGTEHKTWLGFEVL